MSRLSQIGQLLCDNDGDPILSHYYDEVPLSAWFFDGNTKVRAVITGGPLAGTYDDYVGWIGADLSTLSAPSFTAYFSRHGATVFAGVQVRLLYRFTDGGTAAWQAWCQIMLDVGSTETWTTGPTFDGTTNELSGVSAAFVVGSATVVLTFGPSAW